MVPGVFLGSAFWWLLQSGALHMLRRRIPARAVRGLKLAAGAMIALYGLARAVSAGITLTGGAIPF